MLWQSFPFERVTTRAIMEQSLNPGGGKVVARRIDCLSYGNTDIALGCGALCELSQVRCIADIMVKLANTRKWCDGSPLAQVLDEIETILDGIAASTRLGNILIRVICRPRR